MVLNQLSSLTSRSSIIDIHKTWVNVYMTWFHITEIDALNEESGLIGHCMSTIIFFFDQLIFATFDINRNTVECIKRTGPDVAWCCRIDLIRLSSRNQAEMREKRAQDVYVIVLNNSANHYQLNIEWLCAMFIDLW